MLHRTRKNRAEKATRILVFMLVLFLISLDLTLAENVVYTSGINTLSISCSDCIPGNDYSLLVISGSDSQGSFNSSNLLFIDQITANSNGDIFVAFVNPSFPSCSVFLGGQFQSGSSSPIKLGVYIPEESVPEKSFVLPDVLTTIEDEAFYGCSFTHVYLGEHVTSIGSKAFANSNSLVYIFIPKLTTIIAEDAFWNSSNIVIGCHAGSYAQQYAQLNGIPHRAVD